MSSDGTDMLVAIPFSVGGGEGTQDIILSGDLLPWPLLVHLNGFSTVSCTARGF